MMTALQRTKLNLAELLNGVAQVSLNKSVDISGLTINSREVKPGDLFVAMQGLHSNGMKYIQQAITNGAVAVIKEAYVYDGQENVVPFESVKVAIPVIEVLNLHHQLAHIASRFYGDPSAQLNVVGITGTNGKTSCSQFLAQALDDNHSAAVMGTLGNGFLNQLTTTQHTTPDVVTVHKLLNDYREQGAKHVVMEVSSHGIDQGRVDEVKFNLAIFTNLSRDHLDYHSTMEKYAASKQRLFTEFNVAAAIINIDDKFGEQLIEKSKLCEKTISYGFTDKKPGTHHVIASDLIQSPQGMQFTIQTSWGNAQVHSVLIGRFNASNLLAVIAALLVMDIPIKDVVQKVKDFKAVEGRMQCVSNQKKSPLVVVDYSHTPDALEKALDALIQHRSISDSKIWCVFGCGGDRDNGKRSLMGAVAQRYAQKIILTDDNPRNESPELIIQDILSGIDDSLEAEKKITVLHDRQQAIQYAISNASEADIVLLSGKGHENYQILGDVKHDYPTDNQIAQSALERRLSGGDK